MQDKKRMRDGLVGLSLILSPRDPINPDTDKGHALLNIWAEDLKNFTDDEIAWAITEARQTLKYMPKVSELIRLCWQARAKFQDDLDRLPRDTSICPMCKTKYRWGRVYSDGTTCQTMTCDCGFAALDRYHRPQEAGGLLA